MSFVGRKHWRRYAVGMLIELLFIVSLAVMALVAVAVTTVAAR